MKKPIAITLLAGALLSVTACQSGMQVASRYFPVVDPAQTDPAKYEADLGACRQIAAAKYDEYQDRQWREVFAGALAGAFTGAVAGQAIGGDTQSTLTGAGVGAGVGAGSGYSMATDPKGATQRIIDRCMAGRGHRILNDLGDA